jgi:rhodanese-related sulfurtransferase
MIAPADAPTPVGILHATLGEQDPLTPEVNTDEMRGIVDARSALVIDCRPRRQFEAGHIPGSICLDKPPAEQVAAVDRIVGGDRRKPLVIYCNGPHCHQSRKLGDGLAAAGFTAVRRYQLGISVWRVLGGPTSVGLGWIERVVDHDETAVLLDVRPAEAFAAGSLPRARSSPLAIVNASRGSPAIPGMPNDDFNRRVILFGRDGAEAREMAELLRHRPWANVSFYDGTYEELASAVV